MNFPRTLRVKVGERDTHKLEELSMAQLQRLADEFDLGRIVQMDTPFSTQCNLTDPFRTGQGTFILRARHGEEYGERVEFLHEVMRFLRKRGFPVPEVIPTRGGKAWTLWGDRLVEVQRFIPHDTGTHRDWTRMNAAASTLGDLHRLLRGFPKAKTFVPPEMRNDLTPDECLEYSDSILLRLKSDEAPDSEEVLEAVKAVETVQRIASTLTTNYERIVGSMPWSIVHGDYHPWNLLYTADAVAGVVDYDFLQERERLFDIAYALRNLVASLDFPPGSGDAGYDALAWWKLKLWLDQYDESTYLPLSDVERAHLPTELIRLQLVEIIAAGLQEEPIDPIVRASRGLQVYEWLYNQSLLFV